MSEVQGYQTQAFAEALAEAAHRLDDGCAPPWATTFESDRLFRTVRALAGAAGMGDAALYVAMDDGQGLGAAYSLGKGSHFSAAVTVEEGFPLHGLPPHGNVVVVRFKDCEPSATIDIEVLRLKDGLRHGHEANGPGYVKVAEGVVTGNYYVEGADVTSIVPDVTAPAVEKMPSVWAADAECCMSASEETEWPTAILDECAETIGDSSPTYLRHSRAP